jgi:N-acetyl-gamma-glutamyl-phosphate reductase
VPYRVFAHQHVTETSQTLAALSGAPASVHFVPHLLGVTRGILSTMHVVLARSITKQALLDRYREFYAGQPFVRVLPTPPTLKGTAGSNYCDISVEVSPDGRRAVVISSIDNLLKGQSGTAMQNVNLMFGLDARVGLDRPPLYP